jgi:AcrR family transcriptional regulator
MDAPPKTARVPYAVPRAATSNVVVPTVAPEPAPERPVVSRESVLDAAVQMHAIHGPNEVTVEHVARAAGVSVADVQRTVGGKRELLAEVARCWCDLALLGAMWTWYAPYYWYWWMDIPVSDEGSRREPR